MSTIDRIFVLAEAGIAVSFHAGLSDDRSFGCCISDSTGLLWANSVWDWQHGGDMAAVTNAALDAAEEHLRSRPDPVERFITQQIAGVEK